MAITLTHTPSATTVQLPDAMDWSDEFSWSGVEQTQTYTSTGALLIEEAIKQAGRPHTLVGGEDRTWCTRAHVQTLHTWASTPGITLTLTIRGIARPVTWDRQRGALEGLPVVFFEDGSIASTDFYVPTLRLIGI